jgi:hypothetical protein
MHLQLSPCLLHVCILNYSTNSSSDVTLAAITLCVHTCAESRVRHTAIKLRNTR